MKISFYKNSNTKMPVLEFIKSLPIEDRANTLGCFKNIETLGFSCPRVQFRHIRGKLWEIKIRVASGGYRFFYVTLQHETLVLLHAYKKQSAKAPNKELLIAEKRLLEVSNNESNYLN
jgi:phage-related protein